MAQPADFHTWQIFFAHDCNLRCKYCCTGYGGSGGSRGVMNREVMDLTARAMLSMSPENERVTIEFGGGETFLFADEFLFFTDIIEEVFKGSGKETKIHVSTNGTLLTKELMRELVRKNISLTFSIDGPPEAHNKMRPLTDGGPTHETALRNWNIYRELTKNTGIICNVSSVFSDASRLEDMVEFWLKQDLKVFDVVIETPSNFTKSSDKSQLRARQERYLKELGEWARKMNSTVDKMTFLADYYGPTDLYMAWRNILLESGNAPCGAGSNMIGVDKNGALYPCEGFISNGSWTLGDLRAGLSVERLEEFRHQKQSSFRLCQSCTASNACSNCCFVGESTTDITLNFSAGCGFVKKVAELAQVSYDTLK